MLGLILLLVFKVCSSTENVEAISGSNTTLTCPLQGSSFLWEKLVKLGNNSDWSKLQQGAKYGNVTTASLIIYNVDPGDAGEYLCTVGSQRVNIQVTVKVKGNWSLWGDWTQCTKTCAGGTRTRYRACNNPSPVNGGSPCLGLDNQTGPCSTTISCPVNGNWGPWQDWNSCSATCGNGSRTRYRECNNPEPANGGSDCQGNDTEIESCSIKMCPESKVDNSLATIGIGSAAVVVGLLIVFIYILKRYKQSAESPIYDTTEDTGSSNSDLHTYDGLQQNTAIYDTIGDTGSSNSDLHTYDGLQQNTASPTHRQSDVSYVSIIM